MGVDDSHWAENYSYQHGWGMELPLHWACTLSSSPHPLSHSAIQNRGKKKVSLSPPWFTSCNEMQNLLKKKLPNCCLIIPTKHKTTILKTWFLTRFLTLFKTCMKRMRSDPTNRNYEQPISFFDQHNKMGSCAHTFPVASNEEFASHPANITHKSRRGTALLQISFWFQKNFQSFTCSIGLSVRSNTHNTHLLAGHEGIAKSKCILGRRRRCNGLQIERGATLLQLDVFCSGCCCRRLFCSYGW